MNLSAALPPDVFLDELYRIGPTLSERTHFDVNERAILNLACMIVWWLYHHEPEQLGNAINHVWAEVEALGEKRRH